ERGRYTAPNGDVFTYTKQLGSTEDTILYHRDGRTYDAKALSRYERENPVPALDESLALEALRAGEAPVEVVVWLQRRPGAQIAQQVRALYEPQMLAMAAEVQAVHDKLRPGTSMTPDEEAAYIDFAQRGYLRLTDEQQAFVREQMTAVDALQAEMQTEIRRQITAAVAEDQALLKAQVEALDGTIDAAIVSQNAAQITLPGKHLALLAEQPEVARVIAVPVGGPELNNQDTSLGLNNGFWNNSVDGGIWDVGVLDTGVQQDHPNLDHLNFTSNRGTTDSDGHGTGIAGIIASDHGTNRGMAYGLDRMLVGSCSSGLVMGDADWMVGGGHDDPEAINLSCGYGTATDGDYTTFDQFWDGLIDDNRVLVGKSTGNGGDGTTRITHPAPAYNLLAVANVFDQNTTTRTDDVIWTSSSRGPTLGGRKKPDIAAPGHQTLSANNNWATQADFTNIGGTSAAAPHVTGGVLLLTDLRSSDDPKASKAVLLNTADAWDDNGTSGNTADDSSTPGSLWNKTYGWGYLDLWEAWFNGLDVFVDSVDDGFSPAGPDFKLYRGQMFTNEKATVTWHRHVGYNGSNDPTQVESLTDLDLWAYSALTGSTLDSSTSSIDNVEQIAVGTSQQTVLKVDVFGSLDSDLSTQSYALSTEENFERVDAPSFGFSAPVVSGTSGFPVNLPVTVTNNGDLTAFNVTASISIPLGWTITNNNQSIGNLSAGASQVVNFTVVPSCFGFGLSAIVNPSAVTFSYGESLSDTGSAGLTCNPFFFIP
ncbi:MAG: S8 family serine peptidase, partial [Acidobacteriota bacterium]